VWVAEDVDIRAARHGDVMQGLAGADIGSGALSGRFDGEYSVDLAERKIDAEIVFHDLSPAAMAVAWPDLEEIGRLDMRLGGRLAVQLSLDGERLGGELELHGGPGTLTLPELYAQPLPIAAADLKVVAATGLAAFEVGRLQLDLGGPEVDVVARLTHDGETVDVVAEVTARALPATDWPALWPENVAAGGRRWMIRNMRSIRSRKSWMPGPPNS